MKQHKKQPFFHKKVFIWSISILLGLIICILLAFRLSPWPGAMIIRWVFEQNDAKMTQALAKHQPTAPVSAIRDQQYRSGDGDALLDVYFPASTTGDTKLPLVIWTHGGAWVSGGKDNNANYYKLLAAEGFTVISVGYSLGPERTYPTAIHQLNDLYAYVQANADRLHANTTKIIFAGDSAGAQLSSQMATLITNPAYAT